jgi:ADP-ribosyl-(dinitrogen reductase) hydrolase|nr:MAG TPA: hypothetical protein [Caudoviricetes sp.]
MKKTNLNKKDRIRGALYGVAVGDALGAPLEFMSAEEILAKYGATVREMVGGGWLSVEPGEITDDTQMTLAVAEGIIENPENPIPAIGRRFITWHDSSPKDIGNTCRDAIQSAKRLLRTGADASEAWSCAGQEVAERSAGRNAGNGALMRTIYPALYYSEDAAIEWAVRIGAMTHRNENSDKYCKMYTQLVSTALKNGRETLGSIQALAEVFPKFPPTGWVVGSFCCAIHSLANTTSFEDAVVHAVNLGGDADTIGAITGGLAGAIYGYANIPARWVAHLEPDVCQALEKSVGAAL